KLIKDLEIKIKEDIDYYNDGIAQASNKYKTEIENHASEDSTCTSSSEFHWETIIAEKTKKLEQFHNVLNSTLKVFDGDTSDPYGDTDVNQAIPNSIT